MGFIDFVKGAGAKIFGDDEAEKREAAEAQADAAEAQRLADRRRAAALAEMVGRLGIEVSDLAVKVEGDQVTVSGTAGSQADREKAVLVLGNTAGIARVDDRLGVADAEPEAIYYTVVSGDTLSKIAKEHYGNAMKYPVIFEANRPMLENPDRIYPGQVLRIPPLEE